MKIKKFFKSQAGFTLIELLVVIGIIAVLATIGTISFGNASAKARDSKRQADLRTLGSGLQIYFVNKGIFPGTVEAAGWNALQEITGVSGVAPAKKTDFYCYYTNVALGLAGSKYLLVATDIEGEIPASSLASASLPADITSVVGGSRFSRGIKGDGAVAAQTDCPLTECMVGGTAKANDQSLCTLGGSTVLE